MNYTSLQGSLDANRSLGATAVGVLVPWGQCRVQLLENRVSPLRQLLKTLSKLLTISAVGVIGVCRAIKIFLIILAGSQSSAEAGIDNVVGKIPSLCSVDITSRDIEGIIGRQRKSNAMFATNKARRLGMLQFRV